MTIPTFFHHIRYGVGDVLMDGLLILNANHEGHNIATLSLSLSLSLECKYSEGGFDEIFPRLRIFPPKRKSAHALMPLFRLGSVHSGSSG